MRTRTAQSLWPRILPSNRRWRVAGNSAFVEPIADIARGVLLESSARPNAFYLWVFVLPLYIPQSDLDLTCGSRLRTSESAMWDEEWLDLADRLNEALNSERASRVLQVSSPQELVNLVDIQHIQIPPSHASEILGYSHARAGRYELAITELQRFERSMEGTFDWQARRRERSEQLKSEIISHPDRVQAIMDAWVVGSLNSLGLA